MALSRLQSIAILLGLKAGASLAMSQAPAPVRPTPPTRDPHTTGYVSATELPDGSNPPANTDGDFIIGPTHQHSDRVIQNLFLGVRAAKFKTVGRFVAAPTADVRWGRRR
jgi:hypothetical protein